MKSGGGGESTRNTLSLKRKGVRANPAAEKLKSIGGLRPRVLPGGGGKKISRTGYPF